MTEIDLSQLGSLSQDYGGKRRAKDMAPGEMSVLQRLMAKFFGEEAKEPEHAMDSTVEKAEVNYSVGKDDDRCKNCIHFIKAENGCTIVKGRINPDYWCERFKSYKTADDEAFEKVEHRLAHRSNVRDPKALAAWIGRKNGKIAGDAINAAGVLVRAPTGDVLFMRRSKAGDHAGEWAFPGGKVEDGETPLRAARRELKEETGYNAPRLHSFPSDVKIKIAGDSKVNYSTFMHHAKDAFTPTLDAEHTEFKWAKPEAAPQPLHPGVKALLSHDRIKAMLAMDPLTAKGQEIMANMKRQYGENKGERVFYASANKGKISGVDPGHDDMPGMVTAPSSGAPVGKWKGTWAKDADNSNEKRDNSGKWVSGSGTTSGERRDMVPNGGAALPRSAKSVSYSPEELRDMIPEDQNMAHDTILAFDKQFERTKDIDGRLHVGMTPISKSLVNPYFGKEIPHWKELGLDPKKTYHLYRHPDELKKGAATANLIPLLIKHEAIDVNDHRPDLVVGATGTDAQFKDPYLTNSIVVWAKSPIDGIENNKQRELSASYHYDADMTPGVAPDGTPFDGVMRNIKFNHIALVREGRAGHDVLVADSAENFHWGRIEAAVEALHEGRWA